MTESNIPPVKVDLDDRSLAGIGIATVYEALAKTCLSVCIKAIKGLNHDEWVRRDRQQFSQIVAELACCLKGYPSLHQYFDPIAQNHDKWRDSRNFVVHTVWGVDQTNDSIAYCFTRRRSGRKDDIVKAANECWQLAQAARLLQYQVACLIAEGILTVTQDDGPAIKMHVDGKWVRF